MVADPVGHSLSPLIHNAAFRHLEMNKVYVPFRVPREHLAQFLDDAPHWGIKGLNYVMNRYTNLLHLRKRILDGPLQQFEEKNGHKATGKERDKLIQELLDEGVSWRTIKLATKLDRNFRHTDEALVVHGVLSPIATGYDCYVLTADRDVFDQFYQLTELVYDDFASHWVGEQYRRFPDKFEHVHESKSPFMEPGSLAIRQPVEDHSFIPTNIPTCATTVIDVNSLEILTWVSVRPMAVALHFQESAQDGRVADAGNGLNAYMSLGCPDCDDRISHFTVGRSVMAVSVKGKDLKLCVTEYDIFRTLADKHLATSSRAERRKQKRTRK